MHDLKLSLMLKKKQKTVGLAISSNQHRKEECHIEMQGTLWRVSHKHYALLAALSVSCPPCHHQPIQSVLGTYAEDKFSLDASGIITGYCIHGVCELTVQINSDTHCEHVSEQQYLSMWFISLISLHLRKPYSSGCCYVLLHEDGWHTKGRQRGKRANAMDKGEKTQRRETKLEKRGID